MPAIGVSYSQNLTPSSSPTFASITLSNTSNQITMGTTNTVTLSSTAPSASRTYTLPDFGANGVVPLATASNNCFFTTTGNTTLTLPTTGTLATLAGSEALSNKTSIGIGTSTPQGQFDVVGSSSAGVAQFISNTNTAGYTALYLTETSSGGASPGYLARYNSTNGQANVVELGSSGSIYLNGTAGVGIGSTAPQAKLDIVGSSASQIGQYITNTNTAGRTFIAFTETSSGGATPAYIQRYGSTHASANKLEIVSTGQLSLAPSSGLFATLGAATTGTALVITGGNEIRPLTSSRKTKENIVPLDFDSKAIFNLEPVSFDYINNGGHSFGYIAEDTAKILPEIVYFKDEEDGTKSPYSINYGNLVVPIIKELKELREKVAQLSKESI